MSTPSAQPARGNTRRVLLAAGVLVVIVAVVVAFLIGRGSTKTATKPPASTTTGTAQPTAVTSTQAPLSVNGCLGGADPTMAIGSVFTAPLTPTGAVEFTATLLRWIGDSSKTSDQVTTIGPKVVASDLLPGLSANTPAGTSRTVSTQDSVYSVSKFSTTSAVVNLIVTSTSTAADGEQTTLDGGGPYTLGVRDGHWYLTKVLAPGKAGDARSTQTLAEIRKSGTPLPGGC